MGSTGWVATSMFRERPPCAGYPDGCHAVVQSALCTQGRITSGRRDLAGGDSGRFQNSVDEVTERLPHLSPLRRFQRSQSFWAPAELALKGRSFSGGRVIQLFRTQDIKLPLIQVQGTYRLLVSVRQNTEYVDVGLPLRLRRRPFGSWIPASGGANAELN